MALSHDFFYWVTGCVWSLSESGASIKGHLRRHDDGLALWHSDLDGLGCLSYYSCLEELVHLMKCLCLTMDDSTLAISMTVSSFCFSLLDASLQLVCQSLPLTNEALLSRSHHPDAD